MKKYLAVIDMQNDFIDGSLGTDEAASIIDRVRDRILEARSEVPETIIFTRDTHEVDYLNSLEGHYLPVEHCIRGTKGWEINDRIKGVMPEGALVIDKPSFASLELAGILLEESRINQIEIEIIGLCTDICVVSNALLIKAFIPEARIMVNASCCASVTPEKHDAALETMRSCQIEVIDRE